MKHTIHEICSDILSARSPHARLRISGDDCSFHTVRAAYKNLLFLHPDKNPGYPLAAEAFKVVSSAFSELQALYESNRTENHHATGSVVRIDTNHGSRWGAFTGNECWTGQPAHKTSCQQPGQQSQAASMQTRWNNISMDYSKIAGIKAASTHRVREEAKASTLLEDIASPGSSWTPSSTASPQFRDQHRHSCDGSKNVPTSAFHAVPKGNEQNPCSLYSMFNLQGHTCAGAGYSTLSMPTNSKGKEKHDQQAHQSPALEERAMKPGSKWADAKHTTMIDVLMQKLPAASVRFGADFQTAGLSAKQTEEPKPAKLLGSKSKGGTTKKRKTKFVESSESEAHVERLSSASEGIEPCSSCSAEDSAVDDRFKESLWLAPQIQVEKAPTSRRVLSAAGSGAAMIQAGRKKALRRHFSRLRKKSTSGRMQARLKLVSLASKRTKK